MLSPLFKLRSKNCFRQFELWLFFRASLNYSVNLAWLSPYFSQTPSQATIMSSYSPVRSTSMMSGMQVTGCLLKGNPLTCLWLKSPIERVRFSPLILPLTILAPAFSIRYFSCGFLRSWSKERGTHLFPCHRAALESPALAHTIFSGVMATTTAVAPACSSYLEAGRLSY